MNPNNLAPGTRDQPYQGFQFTTNQPLRQKPPTEYTYQLNQVSSYDTNSIKETQPRGNLSRLDPSFKQKNKAMYSSSMNFSNGGGEGLLALNSLARQVNEPVQEKDRYDSNQFLNPNNPNRFANSDNRTLGLPTRDQKMAASAIFPTNNAQQYQLDRFPAFNLSNNNSSQKSVQSTNSSDAQTKQPQTAKQKRERQLMQIKKQLDELNKKMLTIPQKNKANDSSNDNFQAKQQVKPPKQPAVSQSPAIQQNSPGSSSFSNKFNHFKNPATTTTNFNIDNLYNQKKGNESIKQNPPFQQRKPQYQPQQQYNNAQYGQQRQSSQPEKSSFSYETKGNSEANKKYDNYKNDYTDMNTLFSGAKGSQPSYSNNQADKSGSTLVNNYTQSKPEYGIAKAQINAQGGFKKKKTNAMVFDVPQSSKFQSTKPQQQPLKQPVYHPETKPVESTNQSSFNSNSNSSSNFGIRKIQSLNYQDYSIPVPHLKQFKFSDFSQGKKMGKGMFGEVVLARHKETGWICGLKIMDKKVIKQEKYAGQIARELSIQFYLMHRNILTLYGYFQDQKNFYLLVEFCNEGSLMNRLKQERRMAQRDVAMIIRQVCQGVDYIHKQLIIHRDIKPENILFNFGIVKICDFGWAVYRGFGMRKTASGSPLYYPPEIVKGEEYDDKIDIWCIGMMAYECIIGKIPFRVYTENDLNRIVSDQITFPSWVDVTDEAKDFILKTLKKKPEQRMQIRQMLRHPFITKHQETQLNKSILDEFKRVLY